MANKKKDPLTAIVRPNTIMPTISQYSYELSLAFRKGNSRNESTIAFSLCIYTLELTILSRDTVKKTGMPVLHFQINGIIRKSNLLWFFNVVDALQ